MMTEETRGYALRLPAWLYDELRRAAIEEGRSINSHLVYLLRASLDRERVEEAKRSQRLASACADALNQPEQHEVTLVDAERI